MDLNHLHHQLAATITTTTSPALFSLYTTADQGLPRAQRFRNLPYDLTHPLDAIAALTDYATTNRHLMRGVFTAAEHALPATINGAGLRLPTRRTHRSRTRTAVLWLTALTTGEQYLHEHDGDALTTYTCHDTTVLHTRTGVPTLTYTEPTPTTPSPYHPPLAQLASALAQLTPVPAGMFE